MAEVDANSMLTAIEQVRRSGNADQRRIIEEMAQTNEIFLDAPAAEANGRVVDIGTVRTDVPRATLRSYNKGVKAVSTKTKNVEDFMASVADFSKVDCDLADDAADRNQFRMDEAAGIIQGMGLTMADVFLYGNRKNDELEFNGIITRRPTLHEDYCIDMGGTNSGHLTSLVLVKWNRSHTKLIYPKGASGCGIKYEDHGKQKALDANGDEYMVYESYMAARFGISVRTEKSIIRFCNIDLTEADIGTKILRQVIKKVPKLITGAGNIVAYANGDVYGEIDLSITGKQNVQFTPGSPYGDKAPMHFRNVTFRQVDAMLNTESRVTA